MTRRAHRCRRGTPLARPIPITLPEAAVEVGAVDDDGHRAVVFEGDLHVGAEAPARDRHAARRRASVKSSTSGAAISGAAAATKLGRRPLRTSASSVNCETTSASPPTSTRLRSKRPSASGEEPHLGALRGHPLLPLSASSPSAMPTSSSSPRPIVGDRLAVDADARVADALEDDAHLTPGPFPRGKGSMWCHRLERNGDRRHRDDSGDYTQVASPNLDWP